MDFRAARLIIVRRALALLLALGCAPAAAQSAQEQFSPAQIKKGAAIYAQNCAACHGARMLDPKEAFELRTFPPGEKDRFVTSVTKGKNSMPPLGDLFKNDEIEALWAYVSAGEK